MQVSMHQKGRNKFENKSNTFHAQSYANPVLASNHDSNFKIANTVGFNNSSNNNQRKMQQQKREKNQQHQQKIMKRQLQPDYAYSNVSIRFFKVNRTFGLWLSMSFNC